MLVLPLPACTCLAVLQVGGGQQVAGGQVAGQQVLQRPQGGQVIRQAPPGQVSPPEATTHTRKPNNDFKKKSKSWDFKAISLDG